MHIITQNEVESKIIELRSQHVILDIDVAVLYGVETKHINQAVKNNPEKFPEHYVLEMNKAEKEELVKNFDRFTQLKHSTSIPKAFTEKGLYMLATILKSQKAIATTLSIIETFSKVREIARTIGKLPTIKENTPAHQTLMEKTGELISDLIVPEEALVSTESETSIELNLVLAKLKYSTKKQSKSKQQHLGQNR